MLLGAPLRGPRPLLPQSGSIISGVTAAGRAAFGRKFHAVLEVPTVASARDAIRAAIVADYKGGIEWIVAWPQSLEQAWAPCFAWRNHLEGLA